MTLIDQHGRRLKKLRLSLIDACNMRCPYCMPDNPVFMKKDQWLSVKEVEDLVSKLLSFGIEEVRLTGGEPLLRPDFLEIAQALSLLPLKSLSLTTNAVHLSQLLIDLKKTKIRKINISLDSLQRDMFKRLSGLDELETVLEAIFRAQELGFEVKINCVVMRGLNHPELLDFVKFSSTHQIPVPFLELMKIGVMARESAHQYFFSQQEMKDIILSQHTLTLLKSEQDSTSTNFKVGSARIGFIASETDEFCSGCSRLRVDATGKVYPCLFKDQGVSLRGKDLEEISQILNIIKDEKPLTRLPSVERVMHMIGG